MGAFNRVKITFVFYFLDMVPNIFWWKVSGSILEKKMDTYEILEVTKVYTKTFE